MQDGFLSRGGFWVLGQGFFLLALIVFGMFWHNEWRSVPVVVCGVFLLLTGAVCGIAGTIALGRNLTPFPRPSPTAQLVQSGIYGQMRHPLYTAVICGAVGWALVRASWPALLAALVLTPFLDAKARREERWLRRQFPEYTRYEQHVRRFLPRIY
jgi:protein-S-isoprenylcysteine O-methyltransferase Ste14